MYIILTQCFPSRFGGIESLVSNLALNLGKNNNTIVFADQHHILRDSIYDNQHKDLINIRRFGGIKFFRRRKKIKELKLFIQSKKIQCVIADTWKSIELCIEDLNANNIPVICLAHGNELISNKSDKKERISSILNKTSIIVANSNFTADLVKQLVDKKDKVKVVHPGANDLRSVKPDTSIQIKGMPNLLTLSRLEKRKGHIYVLEAVRRLKKQFPNINYIIAGEGNQKNILQQFVKKNDLNDNVSFVGNVNDQQKRQLFENSTIMVMPTLDESRSRSIEGFGIAYLEAAFFGIPSVASKVGGTPEAVLHDNTGIIIDSHSQLFETLNDLLADNNKLNNLGDNAQKRAEKLFTWDKVVNNYLSALQN